MSSRFFHDSPITAARVTLDGAEAHHLLHVNRVAVGQRMTLFDGGGAEFEGVVEKLGRATVEFRILERIDVDRELRFTLVMGVALPKGDRQKWLVEKLTELGVSTLVPLVTERGVAQPTANALERLRRSVVEASKQCGRNRLMHVTAPQSWTAWISDVPNTSGECRLFAHPGGRALSQIDRAKQQTTRIGIGPEGGFSDAEVAAGVDAGWQSVTLGSRILRIETAAIALAATIALNPCNE